MLAGGAAGFVLRRAALAQGSGPSNSSGALTAVKLADNATLIAGAGSNVLAITAADGVALVDGGSAEHAKELTKMAAGVAQGQPVKVLFNTHWHRECTGLNETLGGSGTKIVAHENTRLWLTADVELEWQHKTYKPLPKAALPNDTFYTNGKMTFGGEPIEYGYLPQAHTDGDIYVFLPKSNVLMAGDLVSVGQYPILDYVTGGWIGGMVDAQKALLALANAETRIVPGVGPVQTRADLQAEFDMLSKVKDTLVKLMRQGFSPRDMIAAAPTKEFDAKWGNPELFIANAYRGMWGHVRELGGIV